MELPLRRDRVGDGRSRDPRPHAGTGDDPVALERGEVGAHRVVGETELAGELVHRHRRATQQTGDTSRGRVDRAAVQRGLRHSTSASSAPERHGDEMWQKLKANIDYLGRFRLDALDLATAVRNVSAARRARRLQRRFDRMNGYRMDRMANRMRAPGELASRGPHPV